MSTSQCKHWDTAADDGGKQYNFVYSDKAGDKQAETIIQTLKKTNFEKTPVYTFVGRMAAQKGIETIHGSVIGLYKEILNEAQRKNKSINPDELPIFLIAGPDEEAGKYYHEMKGLKNNLADLSEEYGVDLVNRVIIQSGFAPAYIYMLGSDYLMAPSNFEPCGLVQSEAQAKGTIPVTTGLGGFVDTIYDPEFDYNPGEKNSSFALRKLITQHKGQTGYLEQQNAKNRGENIVQRYTQTLLRTYTDFTKHKNKTKEIIQNTLRLDHGWKSTRSIYEYLYLFGYQPGNEIVETMEHLNI